MQDTPNDRLKLYRIEELNISQKEMSKALGMQQGSYSDIERGKVGVSGILTKLIKKFSINPIWLVEGLGKKKLEDIGFLYNESDFSMVDEGPPEYDTQQDVFNLLDELLSTSDKNRQKDITSELKSIIGNLLIDNHKKLSEINELKSVIIELYRKRENLKEIIKKF